MRFAKWMHNGESAEPIWLWDQLTLDFRGLPELTVGMAVGPDDVCPRMLRVCVQVCTDALKPEPSGREMVQPYKYLAVHQDSKLKWSANTDAAAAAQVRSARGSKCTVLCCGLLKKQLDRKEKQAAGQAGKKDWLSAEKNPLKTTVKWQPPPSNSP